MDGKKMQSTGWKQVEKHMRRYTDVRGLERRINIALQDSGNRQGRMGGPLHVIPGFLLEVVDLPETDRPHLRLVRGDWVDAPLDEHYAKYAQVLETLGIKFHWSKAKRDPNKPAIIVYVDENQPAEKRQG